MSRLEPPRLRYRFGGFVLSPSRRCLLRDGAEVALIPRYFDLLVLLVAHRERAVSRREILDAVWSDVVVSDGALSQAVRSLRRALDDDRRDPRFIRTHSRHGYRFVFPGVIEEDDEAPIEGAHGATARPDVERGHGATDPSEAEADPFRAPLQRLLGAPSHPTEAEEEDLSDAAETLHCLGTAEVLHRLDRLPGHERARALLRDARWDTPGAGPVPLLGEPGGFTAARMLIELRLRRAVRLAGGRWLGAMLGGAFAGVVAGAGGGVALWLGPASRASAAVLAVLPLVGMVVGGVGAAGVGAGLALAEALARSARGIALAALGALGGCAVGATAHLIGMWTVQSLFGRDLAPVAGGFEGLVIGGAAGLGYALSTPTAQGGMATPHGAARARAAAFTGLACAAACLGLTWTGSTLGAMSLDFMAREFPGSQVSLTPLARLVREPEAGRVTISVIALWEGLLFGGGLAWGLSRRPKPRS